MDEITEIINQGVNDLITLVEIYKDGNEAIRETVDQANGR